MDTSSFEERYRKGAAIFAANGIDVANIFDVAKKIAARYTSDEEERTLLKEKKEYYIHVTGFGDGICTFYFGKAWKGYMVRIDPLYFTMNKQDGHSDYSLDICRCNVCDMGPEIKAAAEELRREREASKGVGFSEGDIVEHIDKTSTSGYSHDGIYSVIGTARLKSPDTGEWHDAYIYSGSDSKRYVREKADMDAKFRKVSGL